MKLETGLGSKTEQISHMPVSSPTAKLLSLGMNSIKRLSTGAGWKSQPLQQLQPLPYVHIKTQSTSRIPYATNVDIPILRANARIMARSAVTASNCNCQPL